MAEVCFRPSVLTQYALSSIAFRPLIERNVGIYNYEACPEKYAPILNISRTGRVALMYLGRQSDETLLFIREQSLFRGASQSAVRRR